MSGEKTEKATSKKRKDEEKKGNLLSSKDINTVISIFGIFFCLQLLYPMMVRYIKDFFYYIFEAISKDNDITDVFISKTMQDLALSATKTLLPLAILAMFFGVLGSILQNKPKFNWELLKWDFKKMDLIKGMGKFFSLKSLFDIFKNLIKFSILGVILYQHLYGLIFEFKRMFDMDLEVSIAILLDNTMGLVVKVVMAFFVISIADYAYSKYEYEKKMKMSKQDIKEEHKQQEGDPKVKAKIKQKQREMAMQRMMQQVPDADVVIRNPTHYAVALKYDMNRPGAPILVAKGQDNLALRIIDVAEEAGVVVVENVPLARAIYSTTELEREIPPEFYGTIAEILVYVYKLKNKELA